MAYQVNSASGRVDATATSRKIDSADAVTVKYTTDGGLTISDKAIYGDGLKPLPGVVVEIYRMDDTLVSDSAGNVSFTSNASGVYFIGKLPYGVYYLHESSPNNCWFILTVKDDTAEGSRDGATVSGPSNVDPRPSKQNP